MCFRKLLNYKSFIFVLESYGVTLSLAIYLKPPADVFWDFKWSGRLNDHGEVCWLDSYPEDDHWHPAHGGEGDCNQAHSLKVFSQAFFLDNILKNTSGPDCKKYTMHYVQN